jgi:hypothetical protein
MTTPQDSYRPGAHRMPDDRVQPPPGQDYYPQAPNRQQYYQQQPGQGYYPPRPQQSYYSPDAVQPQRPPKSKRRIFLWVFLAIQALFILWLVAGIATVHTGPTQAQLAQGCYNHAWYPLFKSQADCVKHYGGALQDAGDTGKAIGVGLIVLLWVVVDFFLGVGYGIYKLATR